MVKGKSAKLKAWQQVPRLENRQGERLQGGLNSTTSSAQSDLIKFHARAPVPFHRFDACTNTYTKVCKNRCRIRMDASVVIAPQGARLVRGKGARMVRGKAPRGHEWLGGRGWGLGGHEWLGGERLVRGGTIIRGKRVEELPV